MEGLNKLLGDLGKRQEDSKHKDGGSCTVGYAAPYSLFVHENLEAHHEHGQAKFLEQPARTMKDELAHSIRGDAEHGLGLVVALENVAKKLLAASQELVPEDTGVLKASGYVKDSKGDVIAGSDMTPEEAQAWHDLLKTRSDKSS